MAVQKSSRRGKAGTRSRKAAPPKRARKERIGIEVAAPTAEVKKKLKEIFHQAAVAELGLSASGSYSYQAPVKRGRR